MIQGQHSSLSYPGCRIFVLFLLFCLVGTTKIRAQRALQPALSDIQQQATELKNKDRLPEAADAYRHALRVAPAWADGWWQLGTVEYDLGNFQMCRDSLGRYLSLNSKNGPAWALKGLSEYELGLTGQSLVDLRRADVLGLTDESDLRTIVRIHELLLYNVTGDFERAFALTKSLCGNKAGSPLIFAAAGLTALRISSLPNDIPAAKRDLVYRTGKAVCDASANRASDAHEEFSILIKRYPSSPQVHYLYGCFLLEDYPDEGLAELIKELSVSESHGPAMTQIALEYLRRGQTQEALSYAEKAVKVAPGDSRAQYAMGRAQLDLKQTAPGIRHLRRALAITPSDRAVLWALASAYSASGDEGAAHQIRLRLAALDAR